MLQHIDPGALSYRRNGSISTKSALVLPRESLVKNRRETDGPQIDSAAQIEIFRAGCDMLQPGWSLGWAGCMHTTAPDRLRSFDFFAALSDAAFNTLNRQCMRKTFGPTELIIGHQDDTHEVLFILDGHARVNIYSRDGRRVSFREISQGTIFGEFYGTKADCSYAAGAVVGTHT